MSMTEHIRSRVHAGREFITIFEALYEAQMRIVFASLWLYHGRLQRETGLELPTPDEDDARTALLPALLALEAFRAIVDAADVDPDLPPAPPTGSKVN